MPRKKPPANKTPANTPATTSATGTTLVDGRPYFATINGTPMNRKQYLERRTSNTTPGKNTPRPSKNTDPEPDETDPDPTRPPADTDPTQPDDHAQ